jgi:hypothetical protein
VLAGLLGPEPLPPLLERFRGGAAQVTGPDGVREVPIEALWARLVLVRRALERLEESTSSSSLERETAHKIEKDIAGKEAEFTVNVNEVKEKRLPELNDEFAKTAGYEGVGFSVVTTDGSRGVMVGEQSLYLCAF